jgi:quinol monooxygenase YgiN
MKRPFIECGEGMNSIRRRILITVVVAGLLMNPDSAFSQSWSVTYFETEPAAADKIVTALGGYVVSTREVDGNVGAVALRQRDRLNQFVILAEWSGDEVQQAHAMGPVAGGLRSVLEPVLISGYDERTHNALEVNGGLADEGGAVFVVTHIDVGSRPRETGINLVREMALRSRDDEGSIRFMVLTWGGRTNHMSVIEIWESDAAREAHVISDHMKEFRRTLMPISGAMYDERIYMPVKIN